MKLRKIILISAMLIIALLAFVGCEFKSEAEATTVNFYVNDSVYGTRSITNAMVMPDDPTLENYEFVGWYFDKAFTEECTKEKIIARAAKSDINVYARLIKSESTLTFDSMGGSEVAPITAVHKADIIFPMSPMKEGYMFCGWYLDRECTTPFIEYKMPTKSITLYAMWAVGNYTITFNSNGGGSVADFTAAYDADITMPTDPTRTGYTFGGWYTDSACTSAFRLTKMPAENVNVFAKWTTNSYTITFNSNGSGTIEPLVFDYDKYITMPTTPTRTGYTFGGWYTDSACTSAFALTKMPANNITLFAKWSIDSYELSFDCDRGSDVNAIIIDYNAEIIMPTDPTRLGYTFAGWYADYLLGEEFTLTTMPAKDITVYAKWTINSYTIIFNSNGSGEIATQQVADYDEHINKPMLTRTGYTFGGWYTDSACTSTFTLTEMPANNITLFAKWSINNYELSFDCNGGSAAPTIIIDYNVEIIMPTDPTRLGYTFAGWYADYLCREEFTLTTMPAKDMRAYAKWTINRYTLSFNSQGGSEIAAITANYDTGLIVPTPTLEGYTFYGWYLDSACTETSTITRMPAADTTQYAKWQINSYSITFDSQGGYSVAGFKVEYNADITMPQAKYNGYIFVGWYTDRDCTILFDLTKMPAEHVKVYAKWTINSYTITFNSNGGSEVAAITDEYNADITMPTAPTREGYEFGGWYSDRDCTILFDLTTMPAKDIVVYVGWEAKSFTITYNSMEGGSVAPKTAKCDTAIAMPVATREGYRFEGWSDKENFFENGTIVDYKIMPSSNRTLYAMWTSDSMTDGLKFTYAAASDSLAASGTALGGDVTITEYYYNKKVTAIAADGFKESNVQKVVMHAQITAIGEGAFQFCDWLSEIVMPLNLTRIEKNTFRRCRQLRYIDIGSAITFIDDDAFNSCSGLISIALDNVETIGNNAFDGCYALVELIVPSSVISMGSSILGYVDSCYIFIEAVTVPAQWNAQWNVVNNIIVLDYKNHKVASDGDIIIKENKVQYKLNQRSMTAQVTRQVKSYEGVADIAATITYESNIYTVNEIVSMAFAECRKLTEVIIPNSVKFILSYAFADCIKLTKVTLSEGLTVIMQNVFEGCTSLEEINIPQSLTSISKEAFKRCTSLTTIILPATLINISTDVFDGCTNLTIYADAVAAPESWVVGWNGTSTVHYGGTWALVDGVPTLKA